MAEPVSLLDLRRKSLIVPINGGAQGLNVAGLTARQICDHLDRFPTMTTLAIGGNLSPMEALAATPGAIAAWVASATGHHNNAEAEEAATENLTIEDATNLVQESLFLTFSRGFGPFAARVGALMGYLTVNPSRVPDTRSPTPSPPSEPPPTTVSGTSPPDSSQPTSSLKTEDA
jgi:hypothetical protein